ncbi:MAG: nicotinate phosphoribosyltransferase [Syntrophobacteria bacterium]
MDKRDHLALLTDLYQLTMAQSYFHSRKFESATFSLFIRSYPPGRGYFVSAGLEDVLSYLADFVFDEEAVGYLRSTGLFSEDFLKFLKGLRFTGDVWALLEGRLFFKDEPILEITAPIIEAQIVETFVINQINLQTLIATKASRCVHAAQGRSVVDFSLRRTHGIDAGLKVARASYIGGCTATSNVLAGKLYGIPIVGTMAHSFVTSFESEIDAYRSFVGSFPENATLLIDTYDTLAGAHKAVKIAREMSTNGHRLKAVRIDSGDLLSLAREVRRIFDEAGLTDVKIIGSGGLDEYDLESLSQANAPYDSYGVGTRMGVSADAPWFDMAYKLVEHNGRPVLKLSTGKVSSPAKKQVFRFVDGQGRLKRDVIGLREEDLPGAEPLLKKAMEKGRITGTTTAPKGIRESFLREFSCLGDQNKALQNPAVYQVELSPRLTQLQEEIKQQVAQDQLDI